MVWVDMMACGNEQILLDTRDVDLTIRRMVEDLAAGVEEPEHLALIGIRTHGVTLARRMCDVFAEDFHWQVPLGILDITLYRDDLNELSQRGKSPIVRPTRIDFDISDALVVLVDDVLYTGRTIRCALAEIMDYGRPSAIRLGVLVDRGLRELPIQPDVVGVTLDTTPGERVLVRLGEDDEKKGVWICRANAQPGPGPAAPDGAPT